MPRRPVVSSSVARSESGRSRPFHERMLAVHQKVASGCYPNCFGLARELEVDRKTIQRDVSFMRDRLRLPIKFDSRRNGYSYTVPVGEFPLFEIGEGDLAALFLARAALAPIEGTALGVKLAALLEKVSLSMQDKVRFSWTNLDQAFTRKTTLPLLQQAKSFEAVIKGLLEEREIAFRYRKIDADAAEVRRLRPYHMAQVEGCWYVLGHDPDRGALRTFALPRMASVKTKDARFQRPADFDGRDILARSFGIWNHPGGLAPQAVRIELTGFAARVAQERRWHPSQEIVPLDKKGNRIEIRFEVSALPELVRWVLSWGRCARVIAPEDLVRLVRDEVRAMGK